MVNTEQNLTMALNLEWTSWTSAIIFLTKNVRK